MSGIYIRGMEMPKGCSGCPIDSDSCTLWRELPPERLKDTRSEECPLGYVPEHGDLIERDAMLFVLDKLEELPIVIPEDRAKETTE